MSFMLHITTAANGDEVFPAFLTSRTTGHDAAYTARADARTAYASALADVATARAALDALDEADDGYDAAVTALAAAEATAAADKVAMHAAEKAYTDLMQAAAADPTIRASVKTAADDLTDDIATAWAALLALVDERTELAEFAGLPTVNRPAVLDSMAAAVAKLTA